MMERLRGGGTHQNKKSRKETEKKWDVHQTGPEQQHCESGENEAAQEMVVPDYERENVIQQFKENGLEELIISLSKGSDEDVERKTQE